MTSNRIETGVSAYNNAEVARACGHHHLSELSLDDLSTFDRDLAYLTGVPYAGVVPL